MFRKSILILFRKKFSFRNNTTAAYINFSPTVFTKEGKLRGTVQRLHDGSPYYSFKGIPYAQPPVGELRFRAPLPPKNWLGVYDAIDHGPVCPQMNLLQRKLIKGDENCLHLNVYTKSLQPSSKLPVMVWIHYGAYRWGSGDYNIQGPEFLLQHDVLLVTFNFRLEVLGFLCLDTPEVPGNAGMKDQVLALRWVQNNIEQFGGDRNNVTIFGTSSGGSSVTNHMVSPMSQDLFHKAIAQSGVCIDNWAISHEPKQRALRIGKVLGRETTDTEELLTFLRSVPAETLADKLNYKTATPEERKRDVPIYFVPTVEKKFPNVESFLDENPINLILSNKIKKVPFIIGYNSAEGIIFITKMLQNLDFINKNPYCLIPREVALTVPENKLKEFGERVKEYYINGGDWTDNDVRSFCDVASLLRFVYNVFRFAYMYARLPETQSTYMYRCNYDTDLSVIKKMFGWINVEGLSHGDDLNYFFTNDYTRTIYEEQEELLKEKIYRVTKMWTDFAKTGNPTPDSSLGVAWRPFSSNSRDVLHIEDQLQMAPVPEIEQLRFWDRLYDEAGLPNIKEIHL